MFTYNSRSDPDVPGFHRIRLPDGVPFFLPFPTAGEVRQEILKEEPKTKPVRANSIDDPPALPAPPNEDLGILQGSRAITVFDASAIKRARLAMDFRDKETRTRAEKALKQAAALNGCRFIPDIEFELIDCVSRMRERFPNFVPVIEHFVSELSAAMASRESMFRLSPVLLHGAPGLGKTRFVQALSDILGFGFEMVTGGGMQGPFAITGTASHWSNSGPGVVLLVLASGAYACPVLMIDEIDKIAESPEHPILPALLNLLEPASAHRFRDESAELDFDASRMIVIGTANEVERVSAPLRSRMVEIEVLPPTREQRRVIAKSMFEALAGGLIVEIGIEDSALDRLAESDSDLRGIERTLRQAMGDAVRAQRKLISEGDLKVGAKQNRKLGFV